LKQLLAGLLDQKTEGLFTYSIVVADNDASESAKELVEDVTRTSSVKITYCVEPRRNISLVRNLALTRADGDFIAFIDDDERPAEDWLVTLLKTCLGTNVDGVLGPVLPHFETKPPLWVTAGGFYNRPRYCTGFRMNWPSCRSGNVLARRTIFQELDTPFREKFGSGGEDQDFFRRAMERGRRFIWCDEAIVYESVPPSRWNRRFLLSRALLRGKNSVKHRQGRFRNMLKSLIAIPAYSLAIPILLLGKRCLLMKYCVKLMDHVGRILAIVRLNPIKQRPM
jgi:succinoglycan biosynthesis protein ExoM